MNQKEPMWILYASVVSSKNKSAVLRALSDTPMTPKQLYQVTGMGLSTISRALKRLRDDDIVDCMTPDRRKGKLYAPTTKGLWILKNLRIIEERIVMAKREKI